MGRIRIIYIPLLLVAVACTSGSSADTTAATTPSSDASVASTTSVTSAEIDPSAVRVAIVHERVVADGGWDWAHAVGLSDAIAAVDDSIVLTSVERVTTAATARQTLRALATEGSRLVFVTAPTLSAAVASVADEFPDTFFVVVGGDVSAPNVGSYAGAEEEAWFLAGMAAASVSPTGTIGFIAPTERPGTVRAINAFALGARDRDPVAEVRVVWTNSLFDPPTEGAAAQLLLDQGADLLASYQDSVATGLVAAAAGVPWIGWSTHQSSDLPESLLTAVTWDWTELYTTMLSGFVDGDWTPPDHRQQTPAGWMTLGSGGVAILPLSEVVEAADRDVIDLRTQALEAGTTTVFPDPVTASDGVQRPLGDLWSMDYFVDGVVAP